VKLEPLYRLRFAYPEEWSAELTGPDGTESAWFFFAEGTAEGKVSGRFRGANHPRRRTDHTFIPDFHGVIETDDGATILLDLGGHGRAYPVGRREIVGWATHLSSDPRYARLNDVVCICAGEVRAEEGELVIDLAELVWEPLEG
jgi:hypothetical protein